MPYYYASENPYGILTLNSDGGQANRMFRFESQAQRDEWVSQQPDFREALKAKNKHVRQAKRTAEKTGLEWPIAYLE